MDSHVDMSVFEGMKHKQFKWMFGDKYSLVLLGLKCWNEKDGRTLGEVSFVFAEQLTALEMRNICEKVAEWMGGDLYGTVNIDFSGDSPSLEMMVELHDKMI